MKQPIKQTLALGLAALTLILALAGCGAAPNSKAAPAASSMAPGIAYEEARPSGEMGLSGGGWAAADSGAATPQEAPTPAPSQAPALEGRKVVRYSDLTLETQEFDKALEGLTDAVLQAGGYIQNQDQDGRSIYQSGDYYERRANLTARVPADQLDRVVAQAGELCNLVSHSQRMDDITDHYTDAEARLATLRLQEERLLAILEKAEKLEDVITLESALSQVRYEIESLTGSLQRMDSQVTYSYLQIALREVVEYNIQRSQPKNFWERLGASFGRSLTNLGQVLEGLLFWVIEMGPVLLVYLGFLLVLFLLGRGVYRRWQKRRTVRPQPAGGWGPHQVHRPASGDQEGDQTPPQA